VVDNFLEGNVYVRLIGVIIASDRRTGQNISSRFFLTRGRLCQSQNTSFDLTKDKLKLFTIQEKKKIGRNVFSFKSRVRM
jgi:hypothetical protein